jgi:lipid-A-disaccharide synthase
MNEVKKHIPIINQVIESIHKKYPEEKFLVSRSSNIDNKIFQKYFSDKNYVSVITNEDIYKTIDMCKVAAAASGTITLQIALKKVPMCVFYKLSNITYFLIRRLVKTKFISLVNIVLNKQAIEEFIQKDATSEKISAEIEKIINNESYKNNLIENENLIEKKLLDDSAKININDLILNLL